MREETWSRWLHRKKKTKKRERDVSRVKLRAGEKSERENSRVSDHISSVERGKSRYTRERERGQKPAEGFSQRG